MALALSASVSTVVPSAFPSVPSVPASCGVCVAIVVVSPVLVPASCCCVSPASPGVTSPSEYSTCLYVPDDDADDCVAVVASLACGSLSVRVTVDP